MRKKYDIIILILSLIFNYISLNKKKTALEIARDIGIGYNLGNTFDSYNNIKEIKNPDDQITLLGNVVPTRDMIRNIKKCGFKTIRIPVTWMNFMNDLGIINSEWMSRVKEVVD